MKHTGQMRPQAALTGCADAQLALPHTLLLARSRILVDGKRTARPEKAGTITQAHNTTECTGHRPLIHRPPPSGRCRCNSAGWVEWTAALRPRSSTNWPLTESQSRYRPLHGGLGSIWNARSRGSLPAVAPRSLAKLPAPLRSHRHTGSVTANTIRMRLESC